MHGDFMAGIKCFSNSSSKLFWFIFYCLYIYPLLNWPPCYASKLSKISFVLCILYLYLSRAALRYRFQYVSLLFHVICKFLKTTVEFCSYLVPLNIIWCLLLNRYLINHCAYSRTPFVIHSIGKGLNCQTLFRNLNNMKILEKR